MSGPATVDDVSCQLMTVIRARASSRYWPTVVRRGTNTSGLALARLQLYCTGPRGRRLSSGDWPTVGRTWSVLTALNWASGPTSYLSAGRPPGQLLYPDPTCWFSILLLLVLRPTTMQSYLIAVAILYYYTALYYSLAVVYCYTILLYCSQCKTIERSALIDSQIATDSKCPPM